MPLLKSELHLDVTLVRGVVACLLAGGFAVCGDGVVWSGVWPEAGVLPEDAVVGPEAGVLHEDAVVGPEAGVLHEDAVVGPEAGVLHEDGVGIVPKAGSVVREAGVLHEDGPVSCDGVVCGAGTVGSAGVLS